MQAIREDGNLGTSQRDSSSGSGSRDTSQEQCRTSSDTLEDLAHVSVETGDLAAASAYIDRVAPLARASGSNLDISYVKLAQGEALAAARRRDAQAEALFPRGVEHDPASQVSMRFGAEHELAKLFEIQGNALKLLHKKCIKTAH